MPISSEMRRLEAKWLAQDGWPKRLDWIEIDGLHGWTGQRFEFGFPIMAVTGENGVGKSTVLQSAASVYQPPDRPRKSRYASDFFPDTAWEHIRKASIRYAGREGIKPFNSELRKPGERWRGNPERPRRWVEYVDLTRLQPVSSRVGYSRLAKGIHKEASAVLFDKARLGRFSQIMGRKYDSAKMALTYFDAERPVPVLSHQGSEYSGFHQGAGETTIAELLAIDVPETGLVLIDEVETSLHPRAQRRLIKDLAAMAKERQLQVILTTHSPYVLDELPLRARAYIMHAPDGRNIIYGVSPDFAMTRMDDVRHSECDLYVEDRRASILLNEILALNGPELTMRCRIIDYGAASVGKALGQMVVGRKFPTPTCVFIDGDQGTAPGCITLPGEDCPERVVFTGLKELAWAKVADRIGRPFAAFVDECNRAMALSDPHEWVVSAANRLYLGGDILWQAMCGEWAKLCVSGDEVRALMQPIEDALTGVVAEPAPASRPTIPVIREGAERYAKPRTRSRIGIRETPSSEPELPFGQSGRSEEN